MLPTTTVSITNLQINNIGEPFIVLQQVESTNSYAIDKVQTNLAAHGAAFFALEQTAGRGQRGKTWATEAGSNIIVSVVLNTSAISIHHQFPLSVAVALASYDFFNKYAIDKTAIKWPNDIYWNDRKAAGILIENIVRGNTWLWAIVGIGININQTLFNDSAKNAVSLKQITGKTFDVIALGKELCTFLNSRYQQLLQGKENELLHEYNRHLYKKDSVVKLKKATAVFKATIKNVDINGQLRVQDAAQESFEFGEIEWQLDEC